MPKFTPVRPFDWLKGGMLGASLFTVLSVLSFFMLQTDNYHNGSYSWALLNALHYGPGYFIVYADITSEGQIITTSAFIFIIVGVVSFQLFKSERMVAFLFIYTALTILPFLLFVAAMFIS